MEKLIIVTLITAEGEQPKQFQTTIERFFRKRENLLQENNAQEGVAKQQKNLKSKNELV